jgi:uncharacterized protein YjbJ (UPF0337 family)
MNSDSVKGTIDDATGRARRQVGEWTGNTDEQVKGAAQQVKGKAEKAVGQVRDAVNDASKDSSNDTSTADRDTMDDKQRREDLDHVSRK